MTNEKYEGNVLEVHTSIDKNILESMKRGRRIRTNHLIRFNYEHENEFFCMEHAVAYESAEDMLNGENPTVLDFVPVGLKLNASF